MTELQKYIVNQRPVWKGHLNKINGEHISSLQNFIIRPLNQNDAASMGDLSADIYRHLGNGEECFIHKHEKEYYHEVFNNPDIHYIGIFAGSNLIGMSYIRVCRDEQSLFDEIPGSPVNFFDRRPQAKIAALGADCVRPEYRGNNLNQIMIGCRLELAADLGCTDAASIVDRSNHWNMPPYFNNGFKMFATAIDPADGGKIALMHHNLSSSVQQPAKGISIPYDRFALIDNLIGKGFVGTSYNKEDATVLFVPTSRATRQPDTNFLTIIKQTKGAKYV